MRRLCPALALALVFAWSPPSMARATIMVELSIADLVRGSEVVVRGSVVRTASQVAGPGPDAHTLAELHVSHWLRGSGAPRIIIDEIGVETASGELWIDGTPRYAPGDEVVVFLRRLPGERFRTVGRVQGRFEVRHALSTDMSATTTVYRDLTALGLVTWTDGCMRLTDGASDLPIAYDRFAAVVRSAAAQARSRGRVR
jgi:hypothetical protein